MNVVIVGLGYVGSVTAACFADAGHSVQGVDVSAQKVGDLLAGRAPLQEPGLESLVASGVASGRLSATTDLSSVWAECDAVVVCVGTPSGPSGDSDLHAVEAVSAEIGRLIGTDEKFRAVVITSTIPPGTLAGRVKPIIEGAAGKVDGVGFGLAFSPEFLREGTAIKDFVNPERTILGVTDDRTLGILRDLYGPFDSNPEITTPEVAETVKFAANAWHALKVAFANEIARVCESVDLDSHEVMRIFKSDYRLNISERYLTPGFSFGGSCLPKDVRTLTYRARSLGVRVPVLESILPSNDEHLAFALRAIESRKPRSIYVLGLAFKPATDDLRESPSIPLIEALIGRGYEVRVHDALVRVDKLVGANLKYVQERLPHVMDLFLEPDKAAEVSPDLVIVTHVTDEYREFLLGGAAGAEILDLSGSLGGDLASAGARGLAW